MKRINQRKTQKEQEDERYMSIDLCEGNRKGIGIRGGNKRDKGIPRRRRRPNGKSQSSGRLLEMDINLQWIFWSWRDRQNNGEKIIVKGWGQLWCSKVWERLIENDVNTQTNGGE